MKWLYGENYRFSCSKKRDSGTKWKAINRNRLSNRKKIIELFLKFILWMRDNFDCEHSCYHEYRGAMGKRNINIQQQKSRYLILWRTFLSIFIMKPWFFIQNQRVHRYDILQLFFSSRIHLIDMTTEPDLAIHDFCVQ